MGTVPRSAPAASTVTIDWAAIAANTRLLADRARGEVMAVVKADGFGHGSVEVATAALANGATRLGGHRHVRRPRLPRGGRVDFFWSGDEPVLNEVNTTPGFTEASQVPKMFAAAGMTYAELVDLLIRDAIATWRA